ncbi:MAG: MCE family protein, partial [Azospira oryzae]
VSNLRFYSNSQVQVTINIELKAQEYIRKDSKIKIGSDGLIGNKIVVIYGGSAKSAEIQEGDTLEVEKTFTQEDLVNTLQENNKNLLAITADFKTISGKLASGDGTMGKLLSDNAVYDHINLATRSLQQASSKANQLLSSLSTFSAGLNKDGTLANELVTDTLVFQSIRSSMLQLKKIADTAAVFVNQLKEAGNNPASTLGVLIHDEPTGTRMKQTIKNLESSSRKLDQDLEAAQHSFLLRSFFRKKEKAAKRDSTMN